MRLLLLILAVSVVFTAFINGSCNKPPYKIDFKDIGGYVIGKETCNTDETQDYWLLDFTVYSNSPKVGDTLELNGITYTNVLKVKGLNQDLKKVGMRVAIHYKIISNSKIITTGCNSTAPLTYPLKEIFIIDQGEIR